MKDNRIKNKVIQGFTLLELLLVIAIISTLAGIVVISLSPANIFEKVNNAKGKANIAELKKGVDTFLLDNNATLPITLNPDDGIRAICKTGEICTDGVNLDFMITANLLGIPVGGDYATATHSGFFICKNPTTQQIMVYSDPSIDCKPSYVTHEWNFEEASGTNALDSVGGMTGVLYNTPTRTNQGLFNNAIQFDGVNDYVRTTNNPQMQNYNKATFEVWYLPEESNRYENVFIQHGAANWTFNFEIYNGGMDTYLNGAYQSGGTNYEDRWNQAIITYDKVKYNSYTNGVRRSSTNFSATLDVPGYGTVIGAYSQYGRFFKGKIDRPRIYSTALSDAEINYKFTNGDPNLKYDFEEGTGQTAQNTGGINLTRFSGTNEQTTAGLLGGSGTPNANSPAWVTDDCKSGGGCLIFDGTDDYVRVSDGAQIEFLENISISSWIKLNSLPATSVKILGKWNEAIGQRAYVISLKKDGVGNYLEGTISQNAAGTLTCSARSGYITSNTWYHFAYTFKTNSACRFYLNGEEYIPGSSNTVLTQVYDTGTANLLIGGTGGETFQGANSYLNGKLDDVRLYKFPLKPWEIMDIYRKKK